KIVMRPEVDERLFLIRNLESLYEQWPLLGNDPAKLKTEIDNLHQEAHRHAQYARNRELDSMIVSLHEDLAAMLDSFEVALAGITRVVREGAALVERQTTQDLTGASVKGGLMAGGAYANGATGTEAVAMWAGATLLDFFLEN